MCGGDPGQITSAMVSQAAQAGDAVALAVMHRAGTLLGVAVASLTNLLNPEIFVIGGGVINAGDLIFDPIQHEIEKRAYKWSASILKVVPARLGDDAGIIGAARYFVISD
jgi:glucokinase